MKDISKIRPSDKPIKKWPKWYLDNINDHFADLSEDQRIIARKASTLFKESVANGVIMTKHQCHGTPLPDGYVNNSNNLLLEAIDLYESIGIK